MKFTAATRTAGLILHSSSKPICFKDITYISRHTHIYANTHIVLIDLSTI